MTGSVHPARMMAFNDLWCGLQRAVAEKRVKENVGADGLRLYCYAESTVYDRAWDEFTMLARGIILDPVAKRVVATPFPKFFNVGERLDSIPDLPFETFEKLDGSLIILFHHGGEWRTATKGSLGPIKRSGRRRRSATTTCRPLTRRRPTSPRPCTPRTVSSFITATPVWCSWPRTAARARRWGSTIC
ncbi:hypothetical protein J8F10_03625 [Gemmata sp. G18]|uniref:T4 RNA ligase 1-like N-terminal domain-containing protein n=1 Tax=Gemmata palustris TaxID=2822762 RepID=A0ABS5BM54_9BACT|nr:hypothetical protein [Gemmata palustris]